MAKYEVVRYADNDRGIGAVVRKHSFFGISTWVKTVNSSDACSKITALDTWVNKETGKALYPDSYGQELENFYQANHITRDK